MQSDLLNEVGHPGTTILPLTTQLIDDAAPLRFRLNVRDGLEYNSDVILDQTRTIDNQRIDGEMLTLLSKEEMGDIELCWRVILDLEL